MSVKNRVDEFDIIQEIASKTRQNQDVVKGTIQAYHKIVIRELQNDNDITCKNFGKFSISYRNSQLIKKDGTPVVGGTSIKFSISKIAKAIIKSKEPVVYDTDLAKYEDENVIEGLKKELANLRKSNYHAKRKANIVETNYSERLARVYAHKSTVRENIMTKNRRDKLIKREAADKLNEKILRKRINTSFYLDAITAYPVLTKFYKGQNLTINEINIFIVANHFDNFQTTDARMFGFSMTTALRCLNTLVDAGLMEKFAGKTKAIGDTYSISLLGKKKFTEFCRKINKDMRALMSEYSKKIEDDDDAMSIKIKL